MVARRDPGITIVVLPMNQSINQSINQSVEKMCINGYLSPHVFCDSVRAVLLLQADKLGHTLLEDRRNKHNSLVVVLIVKISIRRSLPPMICTVPLPVMRGRRLQVASQGQPSLILE